MCSLLQVLSSDFNDSQPLPVDVKGKVGCANLKENVCQVLLTGSLVIYEKDHVF